MRLNGMGSQGFYDWIRINDLPGPIDMPPQSWTPPDFWWWFHASRVINTFDGVHFIDNTIQEFPFFSFLLGDMHPHVMSIPFIALFVGIALNIFRLPSDFWRNYRSVYPYAIVLTAALVLGGLGFNNLWDMPTFAALLIGILALKAYREGSDIPQSIALAFFPVGLGNSRTRRPDVLPLPAGHQRRRERHRSRHHAHARHPHVHRLGTVLNGGYALPAGDILADHRPARLGGTGTHGRRARIRPLAALDARLPAQRRQRRRGNRPLHRHPPPSPRWWQSASITHSIWQGGRTKAAGFSQRFSPCSAWDSSSARSSCSSETSSTTEATPSSSSTIRHGYCSPLHPPSPCTTG